MAVKLLGYSERGMINALCHDIAHSPEGLKALTSFLNWFDFPLDQLTRPDFSNIKEATILVEQSFSNFGDLDLLILIKQENGNNHAILIEAKVSTDTMSWKTVADRWDEFLAMFDNEEMNTSNLFVQLHRKVRLIDSITTCSESFKPDFFIPIGKPGENPTVRKARETLKEYTKDGYVWFCAILPDKHEVLVNFFLEDLKNIDLTNYLPRWNTSNWGTLSWQKIKEMTLNSWPRTTAAFNWNEGQIFKKEQAIQHAVQEGQIFIFENKRVFLVNSKQGENCRIVDLDESDPNYFWKSKKVKVTDLLPCDYPEKAQVPYTPRKGKTVSVRRKAFL